MAVSSSEFSRCYAVLIMLSRKEGSKAMPATAWKTLVLGTWLALGATSAHALESGAYFSRPVRLIVPFPPGGGADQFARILQPALANALGHTLVIDNRGGASGMIGAELAARAAPAGHIMLLSTSTTAANPALNSKLTSA